MNENFNYCIIGGYSDVGLIRKANEDRGGWYTTLNGLVGIVCDGMGGHVGGQIASQTAIETSKEFLDNEYFENPNDAIRNAINAANNAIIAKAQAQPELHGMGSTCVMVIIREGKVYYGHVGDSRLYIITNHIITQLTKDHSFVQLLVDEGKITKEQAEQHPRKNEITNALGLANMLPPSVALKPISPPAGACLLLCSDGLTGMVSDKKIERVVSNRTLSIDDRTKELVRLANANGGLDNITVELVEFALGTSDIIQTKKENESPKNKKKTIIALVSIIVMIALVFLAYMLIPFNQTTDKKVMLQRRVENITGHNIEYERGLVVNLNLNIDSKFIKDSCSISKEYNDNIKITNIQDNIIEAIWTDREFTDDKIILKIGADSASYIITFPVTQKNQQTIQEKTSPDEKSTITHNANGIVRLIDVDQRLSTELFYTPFDKSNCKILAPSNKYFDLVEVIDMKDIVIKWNHKNLPSTLEHFEVSINTQRNKHIVRFRIDKSIEKAITPDPKIATEENTEENKNSKEVENDNI